MTREDIEAIRQELKGVKSVLNTILGSDSTATATATSGNQVIANNLLTAIEANTSTGSNPNGQATMVNSAPVVIASNQSAVPISSDTLISIDSNIETSNTRLSNIDTNVTLIYALLSSGYETREIVFNTNNIVLPSILIRSQVIFAPYSATPVFYAPIWYDLSGNVVVPTALQLSKFTV